MLELLIRKQLSEIVQGNNLNYSYDLGHFFKLKKGKSSISVFIAGKTYSLVVKIDSNIEYLNKLLDVQVLYLLHILEDKLKNCSFSNALKEMLRQYEEIKETIGEISDENSTN